jgi:hypothetical protein
MRYLKRSQSDRCAVDIKLRDGSDAQCQRFRIKGSPYCAQHTKIIYGANLSPATRAGLFPGFDKDK